MKTTPSERERDMLRLVLQAELATIPLTTMSAVAEGLGVTKSRVHQMAKVLRRKGLLVEDRKLYCTAAGRRAAR